MEKTNSERKRQRKGERERQKAKRDSQNVAER